MLIWEGFLSTEFAMFSSVGKCVNSRNPDKLSIGFIPKMTLLDRNWYPIACSLKLLISNMFWRTYLACLMAGEIENSMFWALDVVPLSLFNKTMWLRRPCLETMLSSHKNLRPWVAYTAQKLQQCILRKILLCTCFRPNSPLGLLKRRKVVRSLFRRKPVHH